MKEKINSLLNDFEKGRLKDIELLSKVFSLFETKDLPYVFSSLCTKSELKTLANRFLIIKKLKEGKNQHDIAGDLHVGVATITRGSGELTKGKFDFM